MVENTSSEGFARHWTFPCSVSLMLAPGCGPDDRIGGIDHVMTYFGPRTEPFRPLSDGRGQGSAGSGNAAMRRVTRPQGHRVNAIFGGRLRTCLWRASGRRA